MKFYAFLYLSWMITRTNATLTSYPGLALIYDTIKNTYEPGDVRATQIKLQKSPEYLPYVNDIIMTCPFVSHSHSFYQLMINARYFDICHIDEIVYLKTCGIPLMPLVQPISPIFYDFSIGYMVEKIKTMTDKKNIINFPSAQQHDVVNSPIPILELKVDFYTLHTTAVKQRFFAYEPYKRENPASCNNFNIGVELLERNDQPTFDVEMFYSEKNQRKVFHKLKYPVFELELPPATSTTEKAKNWLTKKTADNREYFVKHQLTPINNFTDDASRLATCSFLNIVPVYKKISQGPMKQVEDYIRQIAQELGINSVQVETITHEILQIPSKRKKGSTMIPIYLDYTRSRIPAPRVILKILTYQVPLINNIPYGEQQKPHQDPQTTSILKKQILPSLRYAKYHMIIAIHNELKWKLGNICTPVEDDQYGWQIPRTYITDLYACMPNDPQLRGILPDSVNGQPIDLNRVPVRINRSGEILQLEDVFSNLQQKQNEAEADVLSSSSDQEELPESPPHQVHESSESSDQIDESSNYQSMESQNNR